MIYTVHAVKSGEEVKSESISVVVTVARAKRLVREGWDVRIASGLGIFFQDEFEALLSFDPHT